MEKPMKSSTSKRPCNLNRCQTRGFQHPHLLDSSKAKGLRAHSLHLLHHVHAWSQAAVWKSAALAELKASNSATNLHLRTRYLIYTYKKIYEISSRSRREVLKSKYLKELELLCTTPSLCLFSTLLSLPTVGHSAKDTVLAIQPAGLHGAQEELRAVGIGASVGHGQNSCSRPLEESSHQKP